MISLLDSVQSPRRFKSAFTRIREDRAFSSQTDDTLDRLGIMAPGDKSR
jgi:hypothetical protein